MLVGLLFLTSETRQYVINLISSGEINIKIMMAKIRLFGEGIIIKEIYNSGANQCMNAGELSQDVLENESWLHFEN